MEHILLYLARGMILVIGLLGCAHSKPAQSQADIFLIEADRAAARADFKLAFHYNDIVLKHHAAIMGDKAYYQRAIFSMHPKNPKRSWDDAATWFSNLKKRYPNSPLHDEADIWLLTLSHIDKANDTIKRLKVETLRNKETTHRTVQRNKQLKAQINNLTDEIQTLERQIENLKSVDIGIEQKKREAAEP